jgi:hypothetical protein
VTGALTGLHAATWGAFKDSPYEGFRWHRFLRSVVVGAACAWLVSRGAGLVGTELVGTELLVLVGVCYAAERLATEWWKAILREDPGTGYTIPMRLAVLGRPVDARAPRYAVGLVVATGTALLVVTVARTAPDVASMPWWLAGSVGGVSGWLTAVGGAWKDAPVEGFKTATFFRSPAVATGWALVLAPVTEDLAVLAVAAGGLAVASIETYKTFLAGGPPGKFDGQPMRFVADRVRLTCRLAHAVTYAVLAAALAGAVLGASPQGSPAEGRHRGLVLALLWATGSLTAVLRATPASSVATRRDPDERPTRDAADVDLRG